MIQSGEKQARRHRQWFHCLALFWFSISQNPAGAKADNSEWVLDQTHCDRGKLTLYVSHDAVKIISQRWGYHIVAKAPTWTIYCFRPDEKVVWIARPDQFRGSMLVNPASPPGKNGTVMSATGTGQLNGFKYTKYQLRNNHDVQYGSDEIKISSQAADFLSRYFELPDTGKVPIFNQSDHGRGRTTTLGGKGEWLSQDVGTDLRGGTIIDLVTKSGKKVPFKGSDFNYPGGYKRVAELTRVSWSSSQKDALSDVLGDIGFTTGDRHSKDKASDAGDKQKAQSK